MPVTRHSGEPVGDVMAGVVARDVDPEEAALALRELAGHGFSVVPWPLAALAATGGGTAEAGVARELAAASLVSADVLRPMFESVVSAVTRSEVPPPAWFAQARRNAEARQAFLDEFGALTSDQVAALAGSQAANRRATAHRWQAEGKVFAVTHHTQVLYPGFQFDPDAGRPKRVVADVLAELPKAMTGWALALWWVTPTDTLGWDRPVDLLDADPEQVVRAARGEAVDWAQADFA